MKAAVAFAVAAFLVVGCSDSLDDQLRNLADYFSDHRIGNSPDFFLVKQGLVPNDRVAVVFGFLNDYSFCNEIAQLYMKKYPGDTYVCSPAN